MGFIIRKAMPSDAEILSEMRLEMRQERDTGKRLISEAEFLECNLNFFRTYLADGSFVAFLAWEGKSAAACSGMSIQVHPPTYDNPGGRHGYITNMFTRPPWRHRGAAKLLLDKLVETARETGCRKLYLNASPAGRPLYLQYGFVELPGEMKFDL